MIPPFIRIIVEALFWGGVFLVVYTYVLYPILIGLLARFFRKRPVLQSVGEVPAVNLFVAAYNEEKVISEKVANSLELDYPLDRFKLVIASDGSGDATADIVNGFDDDRVVLLDYKERSGKVGVHNKSIPGLDCDIVVFSDANIIFRPEAIKKLVAPFADPNVGAVSGGLHVINSEGGDTGEGFYWRYESFLKRKESEFGTALGATGPIFAIRKELFQPLDENTLVEDFVLVMKLVSRGWRHVDSGEILAEEEQAPDVRGEFTRKIRIGAGGYQSLFMLPRALNPFRLRVFFPYLSHKVFRWAVPFIAIIAAIALVLLGIFGPSMYFYLTPLIPLALAVVLVGYVFEKARIRLFGISHFYYLAVVNWAYLVGFFRLITGRQTTKWKRGRA
ncbi:MAG: glycosyltransferase family 2 protein [bacterium]|nr:glycosyltransferase family 2 protein [bacterium]